jgi:hypothetical protein
MRKIEMNRRLFCQFVSAAVMSMPAMLAQSGDLFRPIRALLTATEPVTWLFARHSITHGALHTMR